MSVEPAKPVLFFDGVCSLCNHSVDFVMRHDHGEFLFAPLQGETARARLDPRFFAEGLSSMVLLEADGHVYARSDAALRVAGHLRGAWRWLAGFLWVPRPLRDAVYSVIARNRYRWFGQRETCRLPTPEERARFLP